VLALVNALVSALVNALVPRLSGVAPVARRQTASSDTERDSKRHHLPRDEVFNCNSPYFTLASAFFMLNLKSGTCFLFNVAKSVN